MFLTSPRLCIGDIDETIHYLADLLNLRSRSVDRVPCIICSFDCKKFVADALLLHSGSVSLCPAHTNTEFIGCNIQKKKQMVTLPYLLVGGVQSQNIKLVLVVEHVTDA